MPSSYGLETSDGGDGFAGVLPQLAASQRVFLGEMGLSGCYVKRSKPFYKCFFGVQQISVRMHKSNRHHVPFICPIATHDVICVFLATIVRMFGVVVVCFSGVLFRSLNVIRSAANVHVWVSSTEPGIHHIVFAPVTSKCRVCRGHDIRCK